VRPADARLCSRVVHIVDGRRPDDRLPLEDSLADEGEGAREVGRCPVAHLLGDARHGRHEAFLLLEGQLEADPGHDVGQPVVRRIGGLVATLGDGPLDLVQSLLPLARLPAIGAVPFRGVASNLSPGWRSAALPVTDANDDPIPPFPLNTTISAAAVDDLASTAPLVLYRVLVDGTGDSGNVLRVVKSAVPGSVDSQPVAGLASSFRAGYASLMETLKAHVKDGHLVVDEPTSLPDGTELELVIADAGDDLDDAERAALHAALSEAWRSAKAGELRPAKELLDEL